MGIAGPRDPRLRAPGSRPGVRAITHTLSRRRFLVGAGAAIGLAYRGTTMSAQVPRTAGAAVDLGLINGRIHTMDAAGRVVSQLLIRNGRFEAVGNNVVR